MRRKLTRQSIKLQCENGIDVIATPMTKVTVVEVNMIGFMKAYNLIVKFLRDVEEGDLLAFRVPEVKRKTALKKKRLSRWMYVGRQPYELIPVTATKTIDKLTVCNLHKRVLSGVR